MFLFHFIDFFMCQEEGFKTFFLLLQIIFILGGLASQWVIFIISHHFIDLFVAVFYFILLICLLVCLFYFAYLLFHFVCASFTFLILFVCQFYFIF